MRVISGIRKGHKLKTPKNKKIRPTADNIKESLFNILGPIEDNSVILDLFGGTGAIGIEFLSRGANKCYFVDISQQSISIIEENLIYTKLMDKATILKTHGVKAIEYISNENIVFDYIYLDPPYKEHKLLYSVLESIEKGSILNKDGTIIIEHTNNLTLEEIYRFKKIDYRRYGNKSISFYKYNFK
ncbi:MAG TPA: 16S rRNA (guanine(966)-N(2))-methyltransferase RsmD [Tissierellaceae bacterium]|nr:16S rRNA (guanine(966)-N(2))-methyltransferase RsmD [Tissierellaceae bacterium]